MKKTVPTGYILLKKWKLTTLISIVFVIQQIKLMPIYSIMAGFIWLIMKMSNCYFPGYFAHPSVFLEFQMKEMMLKLNEFSHNHHLPKVKMLAKYIRRGISEIDNLIWSLFADIYIVH